MSVPEPEPEQYYEIDYRVTCRTEGCGNENIGIYFTGPVDIAGFICGVCSQPLEVERLCDPRPGPTPSDVPNPTI